MWGRLPVPWTASWTAEDRFDVRPCRWARGQMALWQPENRSGRPMFAKPHSVRQRQAMAEERCDLCGRALVGHTRVSLSQESARDVPGLGVVPLAVEPMVHRPCAVVSLGACPELRRQADDGRLRIRHVYACTLVAQHLTGEATMEFAGVHHPGAVGHLKLAITKWADRDVGWLEAK